MGGIIGFVCFLVVGGSAAYLVNLLGIAKRSPLAYLVLLLVCLAFYWIIAKLAGNTPTNTGTKTTKRKPGGGFSGGGTYNENKEFDNIDLDDHFSGFDGGWFDGDD